MEVSKREIPRPSNAFPHEPSVKVFHNPFDFPNSLVCILDEAVSKGYTNIELTVIRHRDEKNTK